MAIVVLTVLTLCRSSVATASSALAADAVPRYVRISGQNFISAATNKTIVMSGPNVVVKGPPYLPHVSGGDICQDVVNSECEAAGTCKTCYTFNEADVKHMKSLGWNTIRLGVVWAGAQPRDENALDAGFLQRLDAVLNLTDQYGINVVLDNHGDMVGKYVHSLPTVASLASLTSQLTILQARLAVAMASPCGYSRRRLGISLESPWLPVSPTT